MIVSDICKQCKGYLNQDGTFTFCCSGCKHFNENGCVLPYEKRGIHCQIFPFVYRNGDLFICLTCPNWKEFIVFEPEAKERIKEIKPKQD